MESSESPLALPNIQAEAVSKFGTTNNPFQAGFILSDGKLLARPRNTTFHNYVEGDASKPGDYAYNFLGSGAVRFSRQMQKETDVASAEFTQTPTEEQLKSLKSAVAGVFSLAIDFTDIEKRVPFTYQGKPLTFFSISPRPGQIEEFFEKVRNFRK